jgi:hypothetical protein
LTLHPRRPRARRSARPLRAGSRSVCATSAPSGRPTTKKRRAGFDEGLSADVDQWPFQPARLLTPRYRVFPKLGITARTELATALAADSPGVRACGAEGADPVQSHAARTTLATSSPGRSRTP